MSTPDASTSGPSPLPSPSFSPSPSPPPAASESVGRLAVVPDEDGPSAHLGLMQSPSRVDHTGIARYESGAHPAPRDPGLLALESPIPHGDNYHTGAVDGNLAHIMRADSTPNLTALDEPTHAGGNAPRLHGLQAIGGSTSTHPLYPKRFNDDVTDHHGLSPSIPMLGARSLSNPSTPHASNTAAPDGQTGCAPTIPPPMSLLHGSGSPATTGMPPLHHVSSVPTMHLLSSAAAALPHHGHGHEHKARFERGADTQLDMNERDSHQLPLHRPVYEKDANGVYQLKSESSDGVSVFRGVKASLGDPAGAGSGPRAPPVQLVHSSLAAHTISRVSTGDKSHPHGREKLPYNRVAIQYAQFQPSAESTEIAIHIRKCLELRTKFVWTPLRDETEYNIFDTPEYIAPSINHLQPVSAAADIHYAFVDGVFTSWVGAEKIEEATQIFSAPNRKEFGIAMGTVMDLVVSGPVKTFCHNRLQILEARFNLHELLNHDIEQVVQKSIPHRDFYNVRKIDNHVHASAMMNQKHLLRFIKAKLKKAIAQEAAQREVVIVRGGQELTLPQVFESLQLTAYDLSVDTLDMHADKTFHRFDKFNLKYNPIGESRLREIFLKYNNHIRGKYLAEITQQVFEDLESNKYQFAEYRLSIYGAKDNEWDALSEWVVDHTLFSANVRWMIQIPRLYSIYKASGQVKNFAEMLSNIFKPLFEVTVDPSSHPKLHVFLASCVAFDMVDDESLRERPFNDSLPPPTEWDYDPPYALFAYYLYANICALNKLRVFRGLNPFAFRPHSGEAGDIEHLAASFILARGINHGLMLQKSPALQYLYYLAQIGISMSPLSNNLLFLEYEKNPFPRFFKKGLNVTLSTDDPLMIHVTREPLVEEYSVAAQVWKLSAIDMSEIARNSVLQSGFEQRFKSHFIGSGYWKRSLEGNDIRQTNVPDIRIQFRCELLGDEFRMLQKHASLPFTDALIDRII